jgi:prevent-host-death family protein
MKTATVADLRNDFVRISSYIENGETVEITKRGRPFAKLSPAAQRRRKLVQPEFTAAEVKAMRDFELEGEEG